MEKITNITNCKRSAYSLNHGVTNCLVEAPISLSLEENFKINLAVTFRQTNLDEINPTVCHYFKWKPTISMPYLIQSSHLNGLHAFD